MLNSKKTLPVDILPTILQNMSCYLNCLPLEAPFGPSTPIWSAVLQQLEILYRKMIFLLNAMEDITPLLKIISSVFKIPLISQFKVCGFILKVLYTLTLSVSGIVGTFL